MKRFSLNQVPDQYAPFIQEHQKLYSSISQEMVLEIYAPGEVIIDAFKPIDYLRYMLVGKAKILLVHENGNQSIVHFVPPGEFLGELTFLKAENPHKHVAAIGQCLFLSVPMDKALTTLSKDSVFLYNLAHIVGMKLEFRTKVNTKNQNYPLKNRLAAYILTSEHKGIYKEKHTETAEYLGVSYRHLLYTIKEFLDEGTIYRAKGHYLLNKEALKNYAYGIEVI